MSVHNYDGKNTIKGSHEYLPQNYHFDACAKCATSRLFHWSWTQVKFQAYGSNVTFIWFVNIIYFSKGAGFRGESIPSCHYYTTLEIIHHTTTPKSLVKIFLRLDLDICWKYLMTSANWLQRPAGSLWDSAVSALLSFSVLMSLRVTKWSIFSLWPGWLGSGLFRSTARPFAQKVPLKRLRQRLTGTGLSPTPRGQTETWCRDAQWRRKLNVSSEITGRIFFM